jgi:hypothetical protein
MKFNRLNSLVQDTPIFISVHWTIIIFRGFLGKGEIQGLIQSIEKFFQGGVIVVFYKRKDIGITIKLVS